MNLRLATPAAAAVSLLFAVAPAKADLTYQTIDNPAGPNSTQLAGVNNSGLITGFFGSDLRAPLTTGFTLSAGVFGGLNATPGPKWALTSANNVGTLVGYFSPTNLGPRTDQTLAFYEQAGIIQTVNNGLDTNPRKFEELRGVNDHNLAVGFYTAADGNAHGFTYQIGSGAVSAFDFPNSTSSDAYGINNAGDIVGDFIDSNDVAHGYLFAGGKFIQLDAPGAQQTIAYGVNNSGLVVGQEDDGSQLHGFLYDSSTGLYIEPNDPLGAVFTSFQGVNDRGQIVGYYFDSRGRTHGLLATNAAAAAPELPTWAMMLLGFAVVGRLAFPRNSPDRSRFDPPQLLRDQT